MVGTQWKSHPNSAIQLNPRPLSCHNNYSSSLEPHHNHAAINESIYYYDITGHVEKVL